MTELTRSDRGQDDADVRAHHGPILRCTARLAGELDPTTLQPNPEGSDPLATWCLNLLWIERRKCLLATHELTLFTLFIPDVSRADLRQLAIGFPIAVAAALAAEGVPAATLLSPGACTLTRTDIRYRRLLGSMNELAFMCRSMIAGQGGLARCDLSDIRHQLNHTLLQVKRKGYDEAMDRVRRLVAGIPRESSTLERE
jgi:hypothetical protein